MTVWHVYILACADGTYYCGVSNDLQRRLQQHNGELAGGAAYTRSRRPVRLLGFLTAPNRAAAQSLEAKLKKLPKAKKLPTLNSWIKNGCPVWK